jgi:hypothetical protein
MTLQAFAQTIGAIGVISSLIYVAIQIRNNARATRAATYQAVSNALASMWDSLAESPEKMDLILTGGDDFAGLDRLSRARFRMALMAYFRRYENAWFQRRVGTLRDSDWLAVQGDMESALSLPGTREAWVLIRNRSGAEFREFVDGLLARDPKDAAAGAAAPAAEAPPRS